MPQSAIQAVKNPKTFVFISEKSKNILNTIYKISLRKL